MINYNYVINKIMAYSELNDLENVIYEIHWEIRAFNEQATVGFSDIFKVDPPNEKNFILSEDLKKDIIIDWIENNYDIEEIKNQLEQRLVKKSNTENVLEIKLENKLNGTK